MAADIIILCPGSKCRKCKRMIMQVEEASAESGLEVTVQILDTIDELVKYRTWVLPALIINGRMFARGYVPDKIRIIDELKSLI